MNQGIREDGREDQWSLPCSAEGVEPRDQQQQGSEPREGATTAGRKAGDGGGGPAKQEGRQTGEATEDGAVVSFSSGGTRTGERLKP
jgi:hypothetical protein